MDTKTRSFRQRLKLKVQEVVGFKLLGLRKASSSLKEAGNLPTWVYFHA